MYLAFGCLGVCQTSPRIKRTEKWYDLFHSFLTNLILEGRKITWPPIFPETTFQLDHRLHSVELTLTRQLSAV